MAHTDLTAPAPAPERMHALDAVRGFALMAGIVFHATMSFLPGPQIWITRDSHQSATLAVVFFVLHIFRMTTFFLIAGFFAHMTFHRRGAKAFIGDRLKRIALPMVVAWPFLFAAITAAAIWGAIAAAGGHLPKGPAPVWPTFPAFPLTHLWFLWMLLLLYAATLIVRGVAAAIDRDGAVRAGLDKAVAWVVGGPAAALVLAAPVAIVFATDGQWRMYFGVTTPDGSFVPNLEAAVGFMTAFGFGWLLHRQSDLLKVWERRWVLNLALAVAFSVASLAILGGVNPNIKMAADNWTHPVGAATYALSIWCWTFAAIGMAMRFLGGHSPVRRYIADASYWLYLIHLPIVMALQVWVAKWDLIWPVKFAIVLGIAFPLMFASYQLLVRHSVIGAVLNGRRAPRAPASRAKGLSSAPATQPAE